MIQKSVHVGVYINLIAIAQYPHSFYTVFHQ